MRLAVASGLFVYSLFASAVVAAEPIAPPPSTGDAEVALELRPAPDGNAPVIRATVIGVPLARARAVTLTDVGRAPIRAATIETYRDGDDPIAIAVVSQGGEIFMGNDDIEPEDSPARYPGALKGIADAFAKTSFGALSPAGSKGFAITYGDGAKLRLPIGPLAKLDGATFGAQRDYYSQTGTDLVGGVNLALAMLEQQVDTPRRALIVIGDGNDTNNDTAAIDLANLRRRAQRDNIQMFAIIYKSAVSDPGNVITRMIPNAQTVASTDAIAPAVATIASRLSDRFYATFPTTELDHDGRPHDLVVAVNDVPMDPQQLVLPGMRAASGIGFWRQLALGALLSALAVLAVFVRGKLVARGATSSAAE